MTDLLRINIDGGKYTLIQEASGKTVMHRYGEPWLDDMPGTKAILAMGYELAELRKFKANAEADRSTINPRRPLDDSKPDGYQESDKDFVLNNLSACVVWLEGEGFKA